MLCVLTDLTKCRHMHVTHAEQFSCLIFLYENKTNKTIGKNHFYYHLFCGRSPKKLMEQIFDIVLFNLICGFEYCYKCILR